MIACGILVVRSPVLKSSLVCRGNPELDVVLIELRNPVFLKFYGDRNLVGLALQRSGETHPVPCYSRLKSDSFSSCHDLSEKGYFYFTRKYKGIKWQMT